MAAQVAAGLVLAATKMVQDAQIVVLVCDPSLEAPVA